MHRVQHKAVRRFARAASVSSTPKNISTAETLTKSPLLCLSLVDPRIQMDEAIKQRMNPRTGTLSRARPRTSSNQTENEPSNTSAVLSTPENNHLCSGNTLKNASA